MCTWGIHTLPLPSSVRHGVFHSKLQMSLLALPAPPSAPDVSFTARGKEYSKQETAKFKENRKGLLSEATLSTDLTKGGASTACHFHSKSTPGPWLTMPVGPSAPQVASWDLVPRNVRASSCHRGLSVQGRHLVPTGAKTHRLPRGHGMDYGGELHSLPLC